MAPGSLVNVNVCVVAVIGPDGPPVMVVSGAGATTATVNVREAGVASTLPAASLARTANVCWPSARFVYACGEVHAANAALSRRHSNVAPGSLVKANDAVFVVMVPVGPLVIVVSGAAVSTVNVRRRGRARRRCRRHRVARTSNVCSPSVEARVGLRRRAGRVGRRRPGGTRTSRPRPSLVKRERRREVAFVGPVGPLVIVVSGAVVSTVKRARRGRRVDVAGRVGRAHQERVGAVGERTDRARRRARRVGAGRRARAVEAALERRAGLRGVERERR